MNHLDCCHKGFNLFPASAEKPVGFLHQHGAKPLAPGSDAVIHGFQHGFLVSLFLRQKLFHNLFYFSGSLH